MPVRGKRLGCPEIGLAIETSFRLNCPEKYMPA
jgi:hypothetical protein